MTENKITTMKDVADVLICMNKVRETKACDDQMLMFNYGGIPVVVNLTDETPPRLRFAADIKELDFSVDTPNLLCALLELNTEIDPVAVAIDTSNPDKIMLQARTTLRMVDMQPSEVMAEVEGLINAIGEIYKIVSC